MCHCPSRALRVAADPWNWEELPWKTEGTLPLPAHKGTGMGNLNKQIPGQNELWKFRLSCQQPILAGNQAGRAAGPAPSGAELTQPRAKP